MDALTYLAANPLVALLCALIIMNLIAFAKFGIDKRRAERGAYRISEASLLRTAFLGGYLGAKAGQAVFRHKTRKQPFARQLNRAGVMGMLILATLAVPASRQAVFDATGALIRHVASNIATEDVADRPRAVSFVDRF